MAEFSVEVVEVVVYRGTVEAPDEQAAVELAVKDLIANSGTGELAFVEVADRTATVVTDPA